jgi:hypothetical protein
MICTLDDLLGTAFRSLERPESGARFSFWRRNVVLAEQRAQCALGSSGSVRPPLKDCRQNEKWTSDSGRGRTEDVGDPS